MPTQSYLTGSIAGVTLEGPSSDPLKATLIGKGPLRSARAVNNRQSAAGTVYTQSFPIVEGIPFGVRFEFLPPDLLDDIVEAIQSAIDAQTTFAVDVEDDNQSVALEAVVAGSNWLEMPDDARTNPLIIKGPVVMRFLSAGELES